MGLLKQAAAYNRTVLMTLASDHVTGATGLTLTITASKAGGAFAAITPIVTELANGWYSLALTSAHTSALGDLALHITAATADPTDTLDQVVAFDTGDAAALGLSRLDAAVSTRLATSGYTAPDNADIVTSLSDLVSLLARTDPTTALTAVKAVTDHLATMINGTPQFTATALALAPSGGGGGSDPWLTALPGAYAAGQAGYILGHKLPATLAAADVTGNLPSTVNAYASGQDPATLVLAATVDGTLTVKQIQALSVSILTGKFGIVRDTVAKTVTVSYYRANGTSVLATMVTSYSDAGLTLATGRTATYSNLP